MVKVMVDLETLGTRAGCVILSIGAVVFDPKADSVGEEFYSVISARSCLNRGLVVDDSTLRWWTLQTDEAQSVLKMAQDPRSRSLETVLGDFNMWLETLGSKKNIEVYGNGSDFDNAILYAAYAACTMDANWHFWNSRCFRTLKNLTSIKADARIGVHHNALDDAKFQALHANKILRYLAEVTES